MPLTPSRRMIPTLATVCLSFSVLALGAAPTRAVAQEPENRADARAEAGTIAITEVAVIDVEHGRLLTDRTVLVADGWITLVGPADEVAIPRGAEVVDATGLYLLPGLWDAHVHSAAGADWHFPLLIAHGITSVRNLHTTVDTSLAFTNALKRRLASGEILGPRFLANGGVVDGKPAVWPGSAVVETEAEARATVDSLTDGGADFIKTYDRLSPEAFFAIMDRARLRGIPVDGHVPLSVAATDAAAASMRTIEHGTGMLLGCSAEADSLRAIHAQHMRRPDMEDRGVATARLLVAARDSRDERLCMETVRAYRAHGVAVTPTFVARMGPRPVLEDSAAMALLPPAIRTRWRQMAEQGPGAFEAVLDDSAYMAGAAIRNAQMLHDAAVPLLAGTDLGNPFLVPGRSLHRELEVLVDEVGLSPLEALRAATLTPAQAFGMADSLGTVGKGKLSDLVLVRENPLEDIRRLRSIQGVVLAGRYFDREELDELLRRARE